MQCFRQFELHFFTQKSDLKKIIKNVFDLRFKCLKKEIKFVKYKPFLFLNLLVFTLFIFNVIKYTIYNLSYFINCVSDILDTMMTDHSFNNCIE
jgi:hypothetical protein